MSMHPRSLHALPLTFGAPAIGTFVELEPSVAEGRFADGEALGVYISE